MEKKLPRLFIFYLYLLVFSAVLQAQSNSSTSVEGFYISEKNNPNIGFTSFDLKFPFLSKENVELDGGLRFIGATTGVRGGYFAFGYCSELLLRPQKRFQLGLNMALTAGGGAAAPDYDGWLAQGTLFSQIKWKNGIGIRAGLNYGYVSGGDIKGFSPLIGINWKMRSVGSIDPSQSRNVFAWNAVYSELGIGNFDSQNLGFIGAGANWTFGKYLAGDFAIHALANTHGGYMQIILSGGPAVSWKSFSISPAFVMGLGGGGDVKTKGGALYGAQFGVSYSGKQFYTGVRYQYVEAFSKQFGYNGIFVSVGKRLRSKDTSQLNCYAITKAYMGEEGFGNIGVRFVGYEYKKLRLMGATYWAFTHNRGAYAEGLFEAALNAPSSIPFYLITSCGAGAGAGINTKTSSILYGAGIGFASPWKRLPFQIEGAYNAGGNIPNRSISLSYKL